MLAGREPRKVRRLSSRANGQKASSPIRHQYHFLVLHHTNKGAHDDALDGVSGSTGLTAAVDNILILRKKRGERRGTLSVTPREREEAEYALEFNPALMQWELLGGAQEVAKTEERQQILNLLRRTGREMTPTEIADDLGEKLNNVKRLLRKMLEEGTVVQQQRRGPYGIPGNYGNHGNLGSDSNQSNQAASSCDEVTVSGEVTEVTVVTGGREVL